MRKYTIMSSITHNSLMEAIKYDDVPAAIRLVSEGVDVNRRDEDEYGWTPLFWACQYGNIEILELLISNGASTDLEGENKWTPLQVASYKGFLSIVDVLLNHGTNIDSTNVHGWSALMYAASNGHLSVVKRLIEKGAAWNVRDNAGFDPLHQACQNNHLEVVEELTRVNPYVPDMNDQNNLGWSPMMTATRKCHVDIVTHLIDAGWSTDTVTLKHKLSVLHIAAHAESDNRSVQMLSVLIPHCNCNATDCDGMNSLMAAAIRDHELSVMELVKSGKVAHVQRSDESV